MTREQVTQLQRRGEGRPANEVLRALYREAFAAYGIRALWNSRPVADPTVADVLAITESLRVEGDLGARRLAEEIENASLAAL